MRRRVGIAVVTALVLTGVGFALRAQILPTNVGCLHGRDERTADGVRRNAAVALLKAINGGEAQALQRSRSFRPLAELPSLPPTPDGFRLRFYVSDAGYVASLKDQRDPCYFGVFSDEGGFIYDSSPLSAPFVASGR